MHPRLRPILDSFQGKPEELIPILQRVQGAFGYLPAEVLADVSRFARVPESSVYGVATFYDQFRFTPIGRRHILVCRGTSCHVRGAADVLRAIEDHLGIKEGQTTPDLAYSLETAPCLGACARSPCMMVNRKVEAGVTPASVRALLRKANGHGAEPR
ncbi:MAG: NADH-quinone oxidoreductase subunit NuoE [Thermoguttaceae bacterium]|jgi:NADH-quinone oxidoreductase subunit E|nr:NADH-quinone oxidoreductase subunit NuoE [Thermoguttaceae bacterium]